VFEAIGGLAHTHWTGKRRRIRCLGTMHPDCGQVLHLPECAGG
jgi:hypothetical protein